MTASAKELHHRGCLDCFEAVWRWRVTQSYLLFPFSLVDQLWCRNLMYNCLNQTELLWLITRELSPWPDQDRFQVVQQPCIERWNQREVGPSFSKKRATVVYLRQLYNISWLSLFCVAQKTYNKVLELPATKVKVQFTFNLIFPHIITTLCCSIFR